MKAKIGALFLVLMVGMAAVGASYALWSKTITLTGTVATGNVDIKWSPFTSEDPSMPATIDHGWDMSTTPPTYIKYDKNVGSCDVVYDPADPTHEKLIVTIRNAYPSYACRIVGDITNAGSIPVKLNDFVYDLPADGAISVRPSGNFVNIYGTQLEPGDDLIGDFEIHLNQVAAQGATYSFGISLIAQQWNEFP